MKEQPAYKVLELTDEQKVFVLANYDKMKVSEMIPHLWPGAVVDGRTIHGKSIQAFLAGQDKKAVSHDVMPPPAELTPEQKAMIDSLLKENRIKNSLELAKLVFPNQTVKSLSKEWRLVWAYSKQHWPDTFDVTEEPVEDGEYSPPDRIQVLIGLVNMYVTTGDPDRKAYNPNTMKPSDERNLKSLMRYMRNYTFKYMASTYKKRVDRDLFVSTFIRWAHDKSDLTEMEVDQMISAAGERVNIAQMEREIQQIKEYHESIMSGDQVDEKGNKKRFGMTDVEQINGVRTKFDQAKERLKKLMDALEAQRSDRIKEKDTRNQSILNLFEAWQNDPEWRASLIALGEREKAEDAGEVERLKTMDEVIALISGMSEEEAAQG